MNLENFFIPAPEICTENLQIGKNRTQHIDNADIALIFNSDERGGRGNAAQKDFSRLRKEFYGLSAADFELKIKDLGDLIPGKTYADTLLALEEITLFCLSKKILPVVVGGSADTAFPIFEALAKTPKSIDFVQISPVVKLENVGENLNEHNFLPKILNSENLKNYRHLGYQRHLNDAGITKLAEEADFDLIRLAEMMDGTENTEPFLRRADFVSVNCDAVESASEPFSVNFQANGLNRREICAYMKEIGLSKNLKAVGIFNFNFETENVVNQQIMAQMLWYLLEGINIRKTHPQQPDFETYWTLIGEQEYAFKRDIFADLWYFGSDENIENCTPCSKRDFEEAKNGFLNRRLLK